MTRLRSEYPWSREEVDVISRFLMVAEQEFLEEKIEKQRQMGAGADSLSLKKAFQGALWAHFHVREIRKAWEGDNEPEQAVRGTVGGPGV